MSVVAVVTSSPPLVEGGHLVIARALVGALEEAGHDADIVLTPQNRFGRQGSAYLANWLTDVGRTADGRAVDQVISLRWPSYAVRHPVHVSWLNHTMREYYDQWERFSAPLSPQGLLKERARRRMIHLADTWLLGRNVTKRFVQSVTIRRRLERWNQLSAEVLYPPPPPRPYRTDAYEPYLFAVSRFAPLKRMRLIVEALADPLAAGIPAVLAGEGEELPAVQRLIAERGLTERVRLVGRLDEAALVEHLARCRAVVFPPVEEDYGFVTIEAFAAAKAVVTCDDSGGPAELVRHGVNGFVVSPSAAALAGAFRQLADDPGLAERFGAAGRQVAESLTWPKTVERLLGRQG